MSDTRFTLAFAEPELSAKTMLAAAGGELATPSGPCTNEAVETSIWAVLVNDPNSPNTKPPMAIAAIRVIAIRITVARTGEIPILFSILKR